MQIIKSSGIKFKGRCSCGCAVSAVSSEVYNLLNNAEELFATCPECNGYIPVFKVTEPDYKTAYQAAYARFTANSCGTESCDKWVREAAKLGKEIFESHPDFCLKCSAVHAPKEGCK